MPGLLDYYGSPKTRSNTRRLSDGGLMALAQQRAAESGARPYAGGLLDWDAPGGPRMSDEAYRTFSPQGLAQLRYRADTRIAGMPAHQAASRAGLSMGIAGGSLLDGGIATGNLSPEQAGACQLLQR